MNCIRWVVTAALLTLGPGAFAQGTAATPPSGSAARTPAEQFALTRGRALMLEFYAVKLDGLWNAFTPDVQQQWGDLSGFRAFRQTGVQQYGRETQLVNEQTFTRAGESFYVRSAVFEGAPQQVWGLVIGFTGLRVTTFAINLLEDRSSDQTAVAPALLAGR
ncbi:hypothetical protein HNQ07_003832 [Deinococcus metalli]|uniref:DUF3887 domain-containing protein n=1 Tax=Deinococcus metalli TaxID=1141878 RepID=A0A7W8KHM2_9DEIO|nr:hypothetical protein [Deinococcus metalli]MBB5378326.1 hypothetical protein [Deinococcus metalli]GHF59691.1 hypothetical protein GCM10017781_40050 [Deinococcus metalli]